MITRKEVIKRSMRTLFAIPFLGLLDCEDDTKNNLISDIEDASKNIQAAMGRTPDVMLHNGNTVYISNSGSDITGNGTQRKPVKTLKKAIEIITKDRDRILVLDSDKYKNACQFSNNSICFS